MENSTGMKLQSVLLGVVHIVATILEFLSTFLFREMLKRNTVKPLKKIIEERDPEMQLFLLREWAQTKAKECSYVQVAGGLLFTTVASCLQWPSVQNGHWSAAALFYASMLVAILSIVMGSQQSLILPNDAKLNSSEDESDERKLAAPQRARSHLSRQESRLEQNEREYLHTVLYRLSRTHNKGWPNKLHVFALQAPMMFLSWCVVFFLAGLCSVVFGPLAKQLAWNDDAKIATSFGIAGLCCGLVFVPVSLLLHGVFGSKKDGGESRLTSIVAGIPA